MPEPTGEECSLSVETGDGGIIPNDVVCFFNLRFQIELRTDNALREISGKTPLFQQSSFLHGAGTGYDYGTVAIYFCFSFEQKRDIYKKPGRLSTVLISQRCPARPDTRMEDGLQDTALYRILKYHLA